MKSRLFAGGILLVVLAVALLAGGRSGSTTTVVYTYICHAAGGSGNFVKVPASDAGDFNGHVGESHQNGRDIVPPFLWQGQIVSQNWDAEGQAIYFNDCNPVPATSTPTNTPVPTSTNTPVPTSTNTPVPTSTNTPEPTPTSTPDPKVTPTSTPKKPDGTVTPTPQTVTELPSTGGPGSPTSGTDPLTLIGMALILGFLLFGLAVRLGSRRR